MKQDRTSEGARPARRPFLAGGFASWLKANRLGRHWSTTEAAERAHLEASEFRQWEVGCAWPNDRERKALSRLFDIPLSEIDAMLRPEADLRQVIEMQRAQIARIAGTTPDKIKVYLVD